MVASALLRTAGAHNRVRVADMPLKQDMVEEGLTIGVKRARVEYQHASALKNLKPLGFSMYVSDLCARRRRALRGVSPERESTLRTFPSGRSLLLFNKLLFVRCEKLHPTGVRNVFGIIRSVGSFEIFI